MEIGILTAFFGGLFSFLSPCVLPLAPPYLAYLGGTTLDQISGDKGEVDPQLSRRVFMSACFFVFGLGTVFVALGMTASVIGQALLQYKEILGQISGGVIIVFGMHFLNVLRIPLLDREARFNGPAQAASLGTSYVIGVAFAFGWTPCIGPILGSILSIAAQQESVTAGASLLVVYAFGLGVPFLVAAAFIGKFARWARGFSRHLGLIEKSMGVLLIVVGLLMMTHQFERIAWWLLETFPAFALVG